MRRVWTVRQLAREIGVSARSVFDWLRGEYQPVGRMRRRLREITGIEFARLPGWAKELLAVTSEYIESLPASGSTKDQYRNFCDRILECLSQRRISSSAEVTPTLAFQCPPGYRSKKAERHAMGFFGPGQNLI